jgi:hypothetical protein
MKIEMITNTWAFKQLSAIRLSVPVLRILYLIRSYGIPVEFLSYFRRSDMQEVPRKAPCSL